MNDDFETLLTPVLKTAYQTARHLTRTQPDAEDLVQEAVLLALKGFEGFERGTNFRAWFLRILINVFYSDYRKSRRRGVSVSLDDEAAPLFLYQQTAAAGMHRTDADPARSFMSRLDAAEISRAIEGLPLDYRTVCTLYFVEDLSYQAIASVLDCPLGTVRSRLHRGRRLLQQTLWSLAEEQGLVRNPQAVAV
ncbi:MAG TPA: sigma-70 family RNA polymerase sigma factor [Gemmatimonadales bacterium]|jgi:RNA polymerase sigma-70 factor (ECF subfamily)